MSMINTAPELIPTIPEKHYNQDMQVKPSVVITDFTQDTLEEAGFQRQFQVSQADWIKLSAKNKYLGNFDWVVSSTAGPASIEINYDYFQQLIPVGLPISSFLKMKALLLSIKPTSNSLYQGLMDVAFIANPYALFTNQYHGISYSTTLETWWILNRVQITPNNTDEINLILPINFPFEVMKIPTATPLNTYASKLGEYHRSYTSGTLAFRVVVPLDSTSPLTALNYTISGQIIDLETSGLRFN